MCKEASEPNRLRELALQWREFAELGSSASRKDRLSWADYLVRLADQLEQKQRAEPPPSQECGCSNRHGRRLPPAR